MAAENEMRSAAYAQATPYRARIRPAMAGPTTIAPLNRTWFSAMAEGSWSKLTRLGTAAERAGEFSARVADWAPATVYRYQSGGCPATAPISNIPVVAA